MTIAADSDRPPFPEQSLAALLLAAVPDNGAASIGLPAPWHASFCRPNGLARSWLRQASNDAARFGNPGAGREGIELLDAAASCMLLASLIRRARARGTISAQAGLRYAEAMRDLPVFFPEEFCRFWENAKPWTHPAFPVSREARAAASRIAESSKLSDLYCADNRAVLEIFAAAISCLETGPILDSLRHSACSLASAFLAEKRAPCMPHHLPLCRELGLSPSHAAAWGAWAFQCRKGSMFARLASMACADEGFSLPRGFALCCGALGLDPKNAALIEEPAFGPQGLGIRIDLSAPFKGEFGAELLSCDPESLFLSGARIENGKIASHPAFDFLPEPRGDWQWLHSFPGMARALHNGGASVYIAGPGGSGKTDLAGALARAAGKKACRKKSGSGKDGFLRALRWSKALGMLLAEEGADPSSAREAAESVEGSPASLAWLACEEGNPGGAAARAFSFHASLGDLPAQQRRACAQSLFPACPSFARRAGAALRLPGEMAALAKAMKLSGCAGDDWEWARKWIGERSRALEGAKDPWGQAPIAELAAPDKRIAGCPELTELLNRAAASIDDPEGHCAFRGALIMGPPGTGKTMFARALAARCGARVLAPNASELAEDPSRIVRAFDQARALAPCILVLDEADALVADPEGPFGMNQKAQARVNALISQMDGVEPLEGVFVVATSHREFVPDPAAVRAGRLSEVLRIGLPDRSGRAEIWLETLGCGHPLAESCAELSRASAGFSGAEIAEAVRRAGPNPSLARLLSECDRLFWGPAGAMQLTDSERRVTAVHEAGHAFAAWGSGLDVVRACARPGGDGFLGMVHFEREDGRVSMTPAEWRKRIAVCLAGLAAEKAAFGSFSNGGGSDLDHASRLITSALLRWGWSSKGPVSIPKDGSEACKAWIEQERAEISGKVFLSACQWLQERMPALLAFAAELQEKRELSGPELAAWKDKALAAGPFSVTAQDDEPAEGAPAFGQAWDERPFAASLHRSGD